MAEAISFGKYLLLRKLAAGGMGEIFLAKQQGPEGFEKFLVIKRILSHHTDNSDYVDMFFAEARLAAKMSHSNIVQIYEMGEIDGAYFIAMEFVNGKSMKDIIDAARHKGVKIHPAHVAEMVKRLCDGMSYAHNLTDIAGHMVNIIHRDINPHNVLVSYGGETKIIDFGIAKSEANTHKTETGTIKGKFVYMSPEQSAAEKIDKRSDIFSIGIVLYEFLFGENPFQKTNIVLSLDAIQRQDPPLPSTISAEYGVFDDIVAKALKKKADERYQDCAEMSADLQRLVLGGAIARPPQPLKQFVQELFSEQIQQEQRFLQEFMKGGSFTITQAKPKPQLAAFSVTSTQMPTASPMLQPEPMIQPMHRTGSAVIRRRRSRARLYGILGAISAVTVLSVVGLIVANQSVQGTHTVQQVVEMSSPVIVAPPPVPAQVAPTAQIAPPVPKQSVPMHAPTPAAKAEIDRAARKKPNNRSHRERDEDTGDGGQGSEYKAVVKLEPIRPTAAAVPVVVPLPTSERQPESKPRASEAAPQSYGYFLVVASPSSAVARDGVRVGASGTVKVDISKGSGKLSVGDASSPFQVTLHYRVNDRNVDLSVDSQPWSIVRRNGTSLGRTPRPNLSGADGQQRFEFVNPTVEGNMTVTVRYYN